MRNRTNSLKLLYTSVHMCTGKKQSWGGGSNKKTHKLTKTFQKVAISQEHVSLKTPPKVYKGIFMGMLQLAATFFIYTNSCTVWKRAIKIFSITQIHFSHTKEKKKETEQCFTQLINN